MFRAQHFLKAELNDWSRIGENYILSFFDDTFILNAQCTSCMNFNKKIYLDIFKEK